jgi:glycosyltransferase involved in cell wall biosynthesis
MKKKDQIRIFIGTTEIAGYYANLTRGFKALGFKCDYISFFDHPFMYGESINPFSSLYKRKNLANSKIKKAFYLILIVLMSIIFLIKSIFRYDVYIFGFGTSILPYNIDMPILKVLGKKVISILGHGSEARPPYIDANSDQYPELSYIRQLAERRKRRVCFHQKYASFVIGAPFSTAHFANQLFINWFAIGLPISKTIDSTIKCTDDSRARKIRIVHAPSNPTVKGSPKIIQAIDNLQNRGYDIEFVLIHGKTNREVLEEVAKCDLVVDQIYSDTPMSSFAAEAAWLGKPAIVGGYGIDRLRSFVPETMWPPSFTCHPDEIEHAIEYLIENPEMRLHLGKVAQRFVQEKWSAIEVAKRFLRIIEGDIPDEWWLDPQHVIYLEGVGQPIERTKEIVRAMLEMYGKKSLQLDHRSELLSAFLEFVSVDCKKIDS